MNNCYEAHKKDERDATSEFYVGCTLIIIVASVLFIQLIGSSFLIINDKSSHSKKDNEYTLLRSGNFPLQSVYYLYNIKKSAAAWGVRIII